MRGRSELVKLGLLLAAIGGACGGIDDGADEERESNFRHGPPPGSPPYDYFLTAYGGPNDSTSRGVPACLSGERMPELWSQGRVYYSTGAYTFGCGAKLQLEANGRCVVVEVLDNGPSKTVEAKALSRCGGTGYVIDSSPIVSEHLFGSQSAGWSDCFAIQVTPVDESTNPGPCDGTGAPGAGTPGSGGGFIGTTCTAADECSSGTCFTESEMGFPAGMCTQSCDHLCPDMAGEPTTFCIDLYGGGYCVSRCDYDLYANGCREGYSCQPQLERYNDPSVLEDVCLPDGG